MTRQRFDANEWLSVPEVAQVLGTSRQAIYDAIKDGRIESNGAGWGRRIHVEQVFAYALKTGRDPSMVIARIQKIREVDWKELLGWVLAGIGLIWLLNKVTKD